MSIPGSQCSEVLNPFVILRCDVETFENVPLESRDIDFIVLLVEDVDILEEHVWSGEVVADDRTVEGESHGLAVRVLAVHPYTTVAEGFVVVGNEVLLVLLDVWRQHDEEGESLASLLALRQQQVLWEAAVLLALETETHAF